MVQENTELNERMLYMQSYANFRNKFLLLGNEHDGVCVCVITTTTNVHDDDDVELHVLGCRLTY